MKYLVLILLVVFAFVAWRFWRSLHWLRAPVPREPPPASRTLAPCAHCGLFVPVEEMVKDRAGQCYCSAEHRTLGKAST